LLAICLPRPVPEIHTPLTQKDLHQQVKTDSLATRERIQSIVYGLDSGKLNEHPEPTGWSVGEVLEHLCIADELYEEPLRMLVGASARDAAAATREWKPSFFGKLAAGMLAKPGKMKAPKVFQPGPTPRGDVLAAFVAGDQSVLDMMDKASSLDWRAVRISTPAMPAFMPKFNLGDVFRIHAVHTARHAKQIERLVKQL
jgi:hypothetical protein